MNPWEKKWAAPTATAPLAPAGQMPWEKTWARPMQGPPMPPNTGAFEATGSPLPGDPEVNLEGMQNEQEMKPEPYDFTFMGQEISPTLKSTLRPMMDAATGMNSLIARGSGMTVNAVNDMWKAMGQEGFIDDPSMTTDTIIKKMEALGMGADRTKAVSQLAADIGEEAFKGLATVAMSFWAAPHLAAIEGEGLMANLGRSFGQMIQKNPGTVVASEMGARAGGEVGEEVGGPTGGIIGSLVGGGAGASTLLPRAAQLASGTAGSIVGGAAGALIPGPGMITGMGSGAFLGGRAGKRVAQRILSRRDMPSNPLMTADDPVMAQNYAQQAIVADKAAAQKEIEKAISSIGGNPDVMSMAEKFRGTVKKAYQMAQRRADQLWGRVDKTLKIDPVRMQHFTKTMVQEAGQFGTRDLPGEIITDIARLKAGKSTIGDVLAIRNKILGDLSEGVDRDGLRRNYNRLQAALINSINKQYPNNRDLAAAREYSLWLHDHFSRGPLGAFFGKSKGADFMADPQARAAILMRREKGGKQIAEAAERLALPQLEQQAGQLVRSQFQQHAQEMGPEAGSRWLNNPATQRFMKAFAKPFAELQQQTTKLDTAIKANVDLGKSSFLKFADEDIQTATQKVLTGSNKVQRASEIKRALAADPDGRALPAFKNSVLVEFQRMGGNNPSTLQAMLASKDQREVMAAVLNPEEMRRFTRIVDAAASFQSGNTKGVGAQSASFLARFMGAKTVGAASRSGGGGPASIQETGAGAKIGEMIFKTILGRASPQELMAMAVTNPKAERLLFSRIPSNIREIQRDAQIIRDLVSSFEAIERE